MQPEEYENLHRVERDHWFYAGKRQIAQHWIDRSRPLTRGDTLLDFGAGTGLFAAEMANHCRVLTLDSYPESLAILRGRLDPAQVLEPAGDGRIPLEQDSVDCVTALDVLEHLADDAAAVADFLRVLRPGGLAVVTVPASMRLWSDWDVALRHYRRYDRRTLAALFGAGWAVEHIAYVNTVAFPLVWLLRRVRRGSRSDRSRAEDRLPPRWLNGLLRRQFVFQASCPRLRLPFGVGLLLVARKSAGI